MKKQILASVALSALTLSIAGQAVYANEANLQDTQADVTLKAGSGKDVKPVVDPTGDTDEDPATGAEGWALSASISEFKGVTNQNVLKGAQLTLANGQVTTESNQSEAPTIASNSLTLNDSLQPVMSAEKGKGAGAWAALFQGEKGKNENVKLFVPRAGVEAQAYTATITWGLSDAPA
ncbi:TPA: WxL domain-containing protein [Enterococcus faecalis]|uniref:WxL domain-containing protein n=1 Tax=Enterococcus faecalis TaxID=1351 RepID=UPI00032F88FC|nr:WxL domain-containing protein [Enterococcus faecalis]EGO2752230.1 WxL domain-containing protein [Enterococcus faecalis]EGO8305287.1 WxL domain-containing protein [Enterococcus faecalis]EGO8861585.1 WxL domain-containing protein [Enterococcus faecalis]EGO9187654.1 WxL domain-containing protein [Enterococcus faecalis]EHK2995817.1 WxL domain-containing protein [Enterococcus faecalis]